MATNPALVEAIYQILCGGAVPPSGGARSAGPYGLRVDRAAAADDQNVTTAIFTIAGGEILITGLWGVRTVIQAAGASNMSWAHSVGPTALCAATAVTGDTVGTLYSLQGDPADAILISAGTGVADTFPAVQVGKLVVTSPQYNGALFMVGAGNITVLHTAAAGTGSTRYFMTYVPLADGVTVVAA